MRPAVFSRVWLLMWVCLPLVSSSHRNLTAAEFRHENVRCVCECPVQRKMLSWESQVPARAGTCQRTHDSFMTALKGAGQASCATCVSSDLLQESLQCSYVAVAASELDCSCGNVLPAPGAVPNSLYSTAECGLCSCTYQLRRQGLVGGVVIFFMVVFVLLLLLILFNYFPHNIFKRNPYGLSWQTTAEVKRPSKAWALQRLLHGGVWSYLRRSPTDANIGW
eukprot:m.173870 g.173870  ORF g.173870 m.173870 type:complete len:222 (-) comp15313_c4_seq1:6111-6776(-)